MPIDKKAQGKKNRSLGAQFELDVRKKYERKGWIVDKFSSNIDLENNCIKQAGLKYIPGRGLMPGLGFPDFIMFQRREYEAYQLLFVECKTNNILTKIEKQKLDWLVKQGHRCFVAYKDGKEIRIREFVEYKESPKASRKNTKD